jgi:hypothetical protein
MLWVAVRDAPAVALLAGAVVVGVVLLAGRPHLPGRAAVLAVSAGGLVIVALVTMAAASHGGRYRQPLEHVFVVRVLPYPDRVAWFADHGMPQADQITKLGSPVPAFPGGPLVKGVPDAAGDPHFAPWHDWVASSGRRTFLLWLATHPGYVVTEPHKSPERAYNNAEGDVDFYRPPDFRSVPLIGVLSVRTAWLVPLGLLLAAALIWRDRLGSPLVVAGAALAVTAVPHGVMAWHSDGMEVARHLVVPGMQLRLGVLLLAVALLETERSQGLPVTGATGTVAESALAPIDEVDTVADAGRMDRHAHQRLPRGAGAGAGG